MTRLFPAALLLCAAGLGPAAAQDPPPEPKPEPETVEPAEPQPKERRPSFEGPNQTERQQQEDAEAKPWFDLGIGTKWFALKKELADATGLTIGGDYTAEYQAATEWLNEDDAGSGILRFYGTWDVFKLLGVEETVSGKLIAKGENRHRYTDLPPNGFSLDLGHVGVLGGPFSNQTWRLTNLYWRQGLFSERFVFYAGFLDSTDYVDAYILASPWTGFSNLAFSTGSASIDLPNEAALGAMAGLWVSDEIYLTTGIVDANSDPHDPFHRLLARSEFFTHVELGWTPSKEAFYLTRVHLTFWHKDALEATGASAGWGVNASATVWIAEMFLPFIRAGYAKKGGGLLQASVSVGLGLQWEKAGDVLGFAFNWGKPNRNTFGRGVDDQVTVELYYRWKIAKTAEVTPMVSLYIDPALNPEDDLVGVFGIRGRIIF